MRARLTRELLPGRNGEIMQQSKELRGTLDLMFRGRVSRPLQECVRVLFLNERSVISSLGNNKRGKYC